MSIRRKPSVLSRIGGSCDYVFLKRNHHSTTSPGVVVRAWRRDYTWELPLRPCDAALQNVLSGLHYQHDCLQIDMFLAYEDYLPRCYPSSCHTISYMAPKDFHTTTTNVTELIDIKTATNVCCLTEHCTGDNQQSESNDGCMSFMLPSGETWQGGMNTNWCCYIHKNV